MSLRFHEISERNLRILDPFLAPQIESLAQKCQVKAGLRQLDLACGKGELLCQWAKNYGIHGTGVDISEYFIENRKKTAAFRRADELRANRTSNTLIWHRRFALQIQMC